MQKKKNDAGPDEWNEIVKNVMKIDCSWKSTAEKYIDVYRSVRVR